MEQEGEVPNEAAWAAVDPDLSRGELARQVTENPVFREAVESMRLHFIHHIVASTPDQTNVREEAYKQLRHLEMFVDTFRGWLKKAEAKVQQEEITCP